MRIVAHVEELRATCARLGRLQAGARWDSSAAAAFSTDLTSCLATAAVLARRWEDLAAELSPHRGR